MDPKRKKAGAMRPMTEELLGILASWGLQSEESWLRELGVLDVRDFRCLQEDDIKGHNPEIKKLLERIQASHKK